MTYYKKYGYVVDAKETIAYSSPIKQFRKTKRKLLLKNTVKSSTNDEYTQFYAVTSRKPQIYKKKYVQNQNKKTAEHLINKYNK